MNQIFYNISYNVIQQTWNNNIDEDIYIDKDNIYNNIINGMNGMNGMNNYIIMYIFLIILW